MNELVPYQPVLEGEVMTAEEADYRRSLKAGTKMYEETEARLDEAYWNFWRGLWQPVDPTEQTGTKP